MTARPTARQHTPRITSRGTSLSPQPPVSDITEADRETEISTLISQVEVLRQQLELQRERERRVPGKKQQQHTIAQPQDSSVVPQIQIQTSQFEPQVPIPAPLRLNNDPTPASLTPPPRYSRGSHAHVGTPHQYPRSIEGNILATMSSEEIREQFNFMVQRLERIEAEQVQAVSPPGYSSAKGSER